MILSNLVKHVDFFAICCKGHESCCQINKAAHHHVLLTEPGLLSANQVPSPHHVTVTMFHAADKKRLLLNLMEIVWVFTRIQKNFFRSTELTCRVCCLCHLQQ